MPGNYLWQWTAGFDKGPVDQWLTIHWPEQCSVQEDVVRCGEKGLSGELSIDGVGKRFSAALVQVHWRDGRSSLYTLTAAQTTAHLFGSADDTRGGLEIAWTYLALGVEHILTGYDHLLFVLGLLFLVGFRRKLVWTITAFTAAHSLTLASAGAGLADAASAAGGGMHRAVHRAGCSGSVESAPDAGATLAGGARVPVRPDPWARLRGCAEGTWACRRTTCRWRCSLSISAWNSDSWHAWAWPWLLWSRVLSRWPVAQRARTPALYGIGTIAAYWSWLRIAALLG